MHRKPVSKKLSRKTIHDWSDLKQALLEDAFTSQHNQEILFITKYTASSTVPQLVKQLNERFSRSFFTAVCAVQDRAKTLQLPEVRNSLNTKRKSDYNALVQKINLQSSTRLVVIHYASFLPDTGEYLSRFLSGINKPVVLVVNNIATDQSDGEKLVRLAAYCSRLVVRSKQERSRLIKLHGLEPEKIIISPATPAGYANLFKSILGDDITIRYNLPPIKTNGLQALFNEGKNKLSGTTEKLTRYAQGLMAMCLQYEWTHDRKDLKLLDQSLSDIINLLGRDDMPYFHEKILAEKNEGHGGALEETLGHLITGAGYVCSKKYSLPEAVYENAETVLLKVLKYADQMQAPCAMGLAIKGLYLYTTASPSTELTATIERLAIKIAAGYKKEASLSWSWFAPTLSYAMCILPEAMLYAYLATHQSLYKKIACSAFDFILIKIFNQNTSDTISKHGHFTKDTSKSEDDIKPVDVTAIMASLSAFYQVFKDDTYLTQMETAFSWYLGNNDKLRSIYHDETGHCIVPAGHAGVEPTISYFTARYIMEKHFQHVAERKPVIQTVRKRKSNAPGKDLVLKYLIRLSVIMAVILITFRKFLMPSKTIAPALFRH